MKDFHGLIFAYYTDARLRELVSMRTAASLPFCGRYRLIDFSLSAMRNAGIVDVGVIMQRDYQSLLDHLGGGKAWDMARRTGGLRMLPPFGLPEYHRGNYAGTMEALIAVSSYIKDVKAKYFVLMLGDMCANIDLTAPMKQHRRSGAPITAICTDRADAAGFRMTYLTDEHGKAKQLLVDCVHEKEGVLSLEAYIINKETLLELMETSRKQSLHRFHKDTLDTWLKDGGKMDIYVHHGYTALIRSVDSYYKANMDMLNSEIRHELFPAERPVYTKAREEVSTYYGVGSHSRNSLVADNCIIDGSIESALDHCIIDKDCSFSSGTVLNGNERLPLIVPKGSNI